MDFLDANPEAVTALIGLLAAVVAVPALWIADRPRHQYRWGVVAELPEVQQPVQPVARPCLKMPTWGWTTRHRCRCGCYWLVPPGRGEAVQILCRWHAKTAPVHVHN